MMDAFGIGCVLYEMTQGKALRDLSEIKSKPKRQKAVAAFTMPEIEPSTHPLFKLLLSGLLNPDPAL